MELKQRIIGIIVLVALAIILVPLIFDSEAVKQPHEQLSEQIPQQQPAPVIKQVANAAAPVAVPQSLSEQKVSDEEETFKPDHMLPSEEEDGDEVVDVKESILHAPVVEAVKAKPKLAVVAHVEKPKPNLKPKLAVTEAEEAEEIVTGTAGWVVQLGVFSDHANAKDLVETLKEKGFNAFVQVDQASKKKVARVFIGPEQSKNASDKTLQALQKKLQMNGIVVRYRA
ncbi:MAG: SPOR domain-containing protein [Pseudomonadota bacterium]|nr:SPOR domain-containing protein [Pseudomonadota bacterium]